MEIFFGESRSLQYAIQAYVGSKGFTTFVVIM